MIALDCGHSEEPSQTGCCEHLVGSDDAPHYRLLRGRGIESDLICEECEKAWTAGTPVELRSVCLACARRYPGYETWDLLGWRGEPQVLERPEDIGLEELARLEAKPASDRSISPLRDGWLVLTEANELVRFTEDGGVVARRMVTIPGKDAAHEQPLALHASDAGDFAAVVRDRGRNGMILSVADGHEILALDRGSYHNEQTQFPCAFVEVDGRTVVVAASDWNRVDAFDPRTGACLSPRSPTRYSKGEPRPEHYLDYFYGPLLVSPNGRWIVTNGWVWHPVGVPRVWDVRRWLTENVWESEDGPSVVRLAQRAYDWGRPMSWIGDDLIALSRIGWDDEVMLQGVMVYQRGADERWTGFAGPEGQMWSDDRRLFVATPSGLEVWDPFSGERLGQLGIQVHAYNPHLRELAGVEPATGTILRWRLASGAE